MFSIAVRLEQSLDLINDQMIYGKFHSTLKTNIVTDLRLDNDFSQSPSKLCTKIFNKKIFLK
jgi:hypothetical protein